jgi:hypothetical protein
MARLPRNSFYSQVSQQGGFKGRPKRPAGSASAGQQWVMPQGTPGPTALPVDPTYDSTIAGLGRRRDDTLSGLDQERIGGLSNYGYTAQFDANGNATGIAFDPSNPFSQAALLKKRYSQAQNRDTNSYAASGQLYAGSLNNARAATTSANDQATDSQRKAVLAFLARNQQQRQGASTDYELGAGQAYGDRVQRAPQNPLYSAASPAATGQPKAVKPPAPVVVGQVQGKKKRRNKTVSRLGNGSGFIR